MAPKPASTAGKAPASTASKAPAKATEGAKAAKKTSKAAAPADGEKKKRKKVRKETYSSYIYKGMYKLSLHSWERFRVITFSSSQASAPWYGYLKQSHGNLEQLRQRHLRTYRYRGF